MLNEPETPFQFGGKIRIFGSDMNWFA